MGHPNSTGATPPSQWIIYNIYHCVCVTASKFSNAFFLKRTLKVYIIGCIHKTWSNRTHLMLRENMNASVQQIYFAFYFLCICTFNMSYGTRQTVRYRIWHRCQCYQWHWDEKGGTALLFVLYCFMYFNSFFIFIFLRCVVNGFHDLKTLIYFIMRVNFYVSFIWKDFFFWSIIELFVRSYGF